MPNLTHAPARCSGSDMRYRFRNLPILHAPTSGSSRLASCAACLTSPDVAEQRLRIPLQDLELDAFRNPPKGRSRCPKGVSSTMVAVSMIASLSRQRVGFRDNLTSSSSLITGIASSTPRFSANQSRRQDLLSTAELARDSAHILDEKGPETRGKKPVAPDFAFLSRGGILTVPFGTSCDRFMTLAFRLHTHELQRCLRRQCAAGPPASLREGYREREVH